MALSRLKGAGLAVPDGVCLTVAAYARYFQQPGVKERILLELYRKRAKDLRWEEIWDAAHRIRNVFLSVPIPPEMHDGLLQQLEERFGSAPVVVRSSSPQEDSEKASFAGLHDSYVNIRGAEAVLDHVRMVWASLWSDRALLYRKELGLAMDRSSMAVVIQELLSGDCSGVAFGVSPVDESLGVIEAVYGLNQGLVEGSVVPDRWTIARGTGEISAFQPAERKDALRPGPQGVASRPLDGAQRQSPPLDEEGVSSVWEMVLSAERVFGSPQDVEWTRCDGRIYLLQSRPVTARRRGEEDDERVRYFKLSRSFDNLRSLRTAIEEIHLPEMERTAAEMSSVALEQMGDRDLAEEIHRRKLVHDHWVGVYWDQFIPMAHGVRLFGQVFNQVMRPRDPYRFVDLLRDTPMMSLERDRLLRHLADMVRGDPDLRSELDRGRIPGDHSGFNRVMQRLLEAFGDLTWQGVRLVDSQAEIIALVRQLADEPAKRERESDRDAKSLAEEFVAGFEINRQPYARELLDLARASWRLRDDDNIYLGRIEGQLRAAVSEGVDRILAKGIQVPQPPDPGEVAKALRDPGYRPRTIRSDTAVGAGRVVPRQIVGQPAGRGVVRGTARVVTGFSDLSHFSRGEILVCDTLDPNMTLFVALAGGIVERRGGMLIHSAIIAREYGIPCVNGVPDAASIIRTGDDITVDGYLGIVVVHGGAADRGSGMDPGPGGRRQQEEAVPMGP